MFCQERIQSRWYQIKTTFPAGDAQWQVPGYERPTGFLSIHISHASFRTWAFYPLRLRLFGLYKKPFPPKVEMMLSEEGLRDDERSRGFNSKIVVSYDVHLVEGDAFTWNILYWAKCFFEGVGRMLSKKGIHVIQWETMKGLEGSTQYYDVHLVEGDAFTGIF